MLVKYWIYDDTHNMAIDDRGLKIRAHGTTKEKAWEALKLRMAVIISDLKEIMTIEIGSIQEIKGLKPGESKSLSVMAKKCKECVLKDLEE